MSQERPEIADTVEHWAQARLEALAAEAGEVASGFICVPPRSGPTARAANGAGSGCGCERCARPAPPPGPSPSSGSPGAGSTRPGQGHRPSRPTFGAEPAIVIPVRPSPPSPSPGSSSSPRPWRSASPRSAVARSVSRVRMAFRQHAKLERAVAEAGEESASRPGAVARPPVPARSPCRARCRPEGDVLNHSEKN